jgi:hypothetical protein
VIRKLIHIIILLIGFYAYSQNDSIHYEKDKIDIKKFDQKKLDKYKADKDFQYEEIVPEKTWFDKLIKWIVNRLLELLRWLFGDRKAVGVFKFIVTIFPYVIGILMLLLILKVFLNIRTEGIISKAGVIAHINMSEDEEIIQNKDIKILIAKALEDDNFRLAIRYHYLFILQQLESKNLIKWELQKTNRDYERELQDKMLKKHFKDITYLYDFVWYGDFNIDKDDFIKAQNRFTIMEEKI